MYKKLVSAVIVLTIFVGTSISASAAYESELFEAILRNDEKEVSAILKTGKDSIDLNAKDHNGNTALHLATYKGNLKIVEMLLKEPNLELRFRYNDNDLNPLMIACMGGHNDIVKCLSSKIDVNELTSLEESALHMAIRGNHIEVVKILISSQNILINISSQLGETPLDIAKKYSCKEIIELLPKHSFSYSSTSKHSEK